MRTRISKLMGFQEPADGYTEEEKEIQKLIGTHAVENLYAKLPTNRMKALVALHIELGYPQELCASIFGVSQGRIAQELSDIRSFFLGKNRRPNWKTFTADVENYKPHKPKPISPEQLIRIVMMMSQE